MSTPNSPVRHPRTFVTQHYVNGNRPVPSLPELDNHGGLRKSCISWKTTPRLILITASTHSPRAMNAFPILLSYLQTIDGIQVAVEQNLVKYCHQSIPVVTSLHAPCLSPEPSLPDVQELALSLPSINEDVLADDTARKSYSCDEVDLVFCLGGDGLIFHVLSSYFPKQVPPFVPFNMGSMGFLTPFNFDDHEKDIREILEGRHNAVTMRMRLKCVIIRGKACDRSAIHNFEDNMLNDEPGYCEQQEEHHVLNELVIDRGPAPYLSNLEVLCDDCAVTRVQADGLIVATPTGSTAYSLSSGGSMVHPGVPAILFTPICPHSLSFRPVLFPDHVTLEIKVAPDGRAGAWVSFDGRHRKELVKGDKVVVSVSEWSVPTLTKRDTTNDWFESVRRCLRWNERVLQGRSGEEEKRFE